jgi:hypothetical protein
VHGATEQCKPSHSSVLRSSQLVYQGQALWMCEKNDFRFRRFPKPFSLRSVPTMVSFQLLTKRCQGNMLVFRLLVETPDQRDGFVFLIKELLNELITICNHFPALPKVRVQE